MTGATISLRALAAALALTAPAPLAAQEAPGDFDLRPRATPTPTAPVAGPVDPENPVPQAPPPREAAPEVAPAPPVSTPTPEPAPAATGAEPSAAATERGARTTPQPAPRAATPGTSAAPPAAALPGKSAATAPDVAPAAPYPPRTLPAAQATGGGWPWLLLIAGLGALAGLVGWLAWSGRLRRRRTAIDPPAIERPRLPAQPAPPEPARRPPGEPSADRPALAVDLRATRLSATLIATTLTYRLVVTNNGAEQLRDVRIAGDMVAAHASRPADELLAGGAALPELHLIATLAPGESVTLVGDIRLPLVAITPIRRGNAAFFVPLARLRARGVAPDGGEVEGGGTFLVGQEPAAANARLKPFRLDLGPRNYSQLGQQLLPAHA